MRVRGRTNSHSVRDGFPLPFPVGSDRNHMPNPNRRGPRALSEILGELFTVKGYGQLRALGELEAAWNTAVGEPHCHQTRVGEVRRGVLTVIVAHPTLLEELAAFRKPELLQALREGAPATPIQDIRFRVGPIDQPAAQEPERNLSQPRPTPPPDRPGTGTGAGTRPRRRPRPGDNDR
jgi:predicted nucleic acid-binding Zn ribbon protein